MRRLGFSPPGMVHFGPSSSQEDRSLAGFEELAIPLFDSLYNFARWLAQNQNDAEDLVQETYLKALRSYASFEPGTNFRPWIFQILKNTFLSSRSKLEWRMTLAMDSEEDLPATSATPESLLIGRSDIDAVHVQSSSCQSSFAKSFCCVTLKMPLTGRLRKYCRSRSEPLCHAWPEPGRWFASHSAALLHHDRETCLMRASLQETEYCPRWDRPDLHNQQSWRDRWFRSNAPIAVK